MTTSVPTEVVKQVSRRSMLEREALPPWKATGPSVLTNKPEADTVSLCNITDTMSRVESRESRSDQDAFTIQIVELKDIQDLGRAKECCSVDDVVMVNVRSIAEMGAYVSLSEYDNIEGMILLSELSRRRIRSIQKLIRVGRSECVVVLRVDKEKGYIDLSKRRVSSEEAKKCEEKFNKGKAVNSILRHVAELEDADIEHLYQESAWKLDKKFGGPSKSYDAFRLAITENPAIWDEIDLEPKLKETLMDNISRRLTPQPIKLRSDIEVACYAYEGINAVKDALRAGLSLSTEELEVTINLIAPPVYVIRAVSLDKDKGIDLLKDVLEKIRSVIVEKKGSMNVKMEPRAVTETDEQELQMMMQKYERENTEVGGDEGDGDEDEEGMGGGGAGADDAE